jgi:hypothetical protein
MFAVQQWNFCLKHFSFSEESGEILSYIYICLHVQYRYSCENLMKLEFSRQCLKYTQISNFVKIRRVGADLFLEDGQTNTQKDRQIDRHDEVSSRCSQFCETRLKTYYLPNGWLCCHGTGKFTISAPMGDLCCKSDSYVTIEISTPFLKS